MGLLPPTVGERLAKCGTQVSVWGITPGADVTLDVGGGQQTVKVNATATTFTVSGGLAATAKVRALQRVPPDTSGWGNVVEVEDVLLPPAAPLMEASIARCAACVGAWGAAPGSRIELTQGGTLVAAGDVGGDGLACMTTQNRPISFMDSAAITCGVPSSGKGWVKVHDVPDPLPAPTIVPPVFECQNRILVEGLMPGATAEVFVIDRDGVKQSLGTFCACTSRSSVGLPRVMKPGDRLTIAQTMINDRWQCHVRGRESGETPVVPPDARIKPTLQGPLYAGDTLLRVTNQIAGGTITLLRQQNIFAGTEVEELRHLLRASRTRHAGAGPRQGRLGYSGFAIINRAGAAGIPDRVHVRDGLVALTTLPRSAGKERSPRGAKDAEPPAPRTEYYADDARLEAWLLDQAARRGWADVIVEGGGPRPGQR
jgi:hypothetical protein